MWICEAGRELNGRHSTIAKWHSSLHCTYCQYLSAQPCHAATHPPAHPPSNPGKTAAGQSKASLRDWVLLHWETVALGSCYVSSGSFSKVSVATLPLRLSLTTTGYPSPSTLRRQPKPSPRILAQTRASLLLLILLLPLLAGWLADLAGWLALILEPRGRCTGCRSGAHYDELQANAAVGVEDRRSIAARFSKAERSVDLICAEATCVPTLLLCI